MSQVENRSFLRTFKNYILLCALFIVASVFVAVVLPPLESTDVIPVVKIASDTEDEMTADLEDFIQQVGLSSEKLKGDQGLALYRQPASRGAVEWFYLHVTGNRDVAMAILEEAERNEIPLSLAFSLAYTESRYDVKAVNKNTNASIDRGLFQLNNKSFPQLDESDFFNPAVSAKYGMSHLKYCLKVGGNQITGLAMYNAGTNKVKSGRTPQSTLNYVGKIMAYQEKLERLFTEEVVTYYDNSSRFGGFSVALLGNRKADR